MLGSVLFTSASLSTVSLSIACSVGAVANSASLVAGEPQSAPEESADMKVLFNGKDLTGWDGDPRLWSVRDGVIHGETTPENVANGNTFLIW